MADPVPPDVEYMAAEVQRPEFMSLLDRLLADPDASHMDVDAFLAGDLLDGHLYALVGLLDHLTRFPSRRCSDKGCVLSTWLFHLAGGHDAKLLLPPSGRANWTHLLFLEAEKRTIAFKKEHQRLKREASRQTAKAAAWTRLDDHRALAAQRDLVD
eukprot:7387976-Prymnesium_polylepis.1